VCIALGYWIEQEGGNCLLRDVIFRSGGVSIPAAWRHHALRRIFCTFIGSELTGVLAAGIKGVFVFIQEPAARPVKVLTSPKIQEEVFLWCVYMPKAWAFGWFVFRYS